MYALLRRILRTLEDVRLLPVEVDIVACGVVDPPRVVDPVHLWCPDVAASRSCLVAPDDFGLSVLESTNGLGACDSDVGPGCGQEVVVSIAGVGDERIRAIFRY